jgi:predicted MFS family arabinose efflux permease
MRCGGICRFALIAFHFQKTQSVSTELIPVVYSAAMAVGAISALAFGNWFDAFGIGSIIVAFGLSSFFAPLVFLTTGWGAFAGMILWEIGMGAQESLLKSVLVGVIPSDRRSTAFGVFDMGFGIAWFIGSGLMGILYDVSLPGLIVFSVILRLASIPLFLFSRRTERQQRT